MLDMTETFEPKNWEMEIYSSANFIVDKSDGTSVCILIRILKFDILRLGHKE
jgi:hypothetical protein